jgi:hypothetical protein
MKLRNLLVKWLDRIDSRSETPRASFTINGFEDAGRIKVEFNWNDAFIKKVQSLGFQAETDEDVVQLFFYTAMMRPTELTEGEGAVASDSHPQLSSQHNTLIT